MCWALRRIKGMKPIDAARVGGFTRQHFTDYLHHDDGPKRRSLPAERIHDFEELMGNSAISQWVAMRPRLTVLEQGLADQRAAA